MARTALDYNPRDAGATPGEQSAGCVYRAKGELISRLLWVATNHRGDWIRFCFNR
jgi:hypothetical protein